MYSKKLSFWLIVALFIGLMVILPAQAIDVSDPLEVSGTFTMVSQAKTKSRSNTSVTLVDQFGGATDTLAVGGDRLVFAAGPRVVLYDVSDPENPIYLSRTNILHGHIVDMMLSNSILYTAISTKLCNSDFSCNEVMTLFSFDVSTDEFVELDSIAYENAQDYSLQPNKIVINNNYLYWAIQVFTDEGWKPFLKVVDVADPFAMTEANTLGPLGAINVNIGLHIADHTLYLINQHTLSIYDIATDPIQPSLLGEYQPEPQFIQQDVVIYETYAYLTLWSSQTGHIFQIIDISNPEVPLYIDDVVYHGTGGAGSIDIAGETLHLARSSTISVYDIAFPTTPQFLSSYEGKGHIVLHGNHAFTQGISSRIQVVDISNPEAPLNLSKITQGPVYVSQIAADRYVFTDNGYDGGFVILDFPTPEEPTETSRLDRPNFGDSNGGMAVAQGLLFLSSGYNDWIDSWDVYTVEAPEFYDDILSDHGTLVVDGEQLYLVSVNGIYGDRVYIRNVADPINGDHGVLSTGGMIAASATDETLFVAYEDRTVSMYDATNIDNITQIGSITIPADIDAISSNENALFVLRRSEDDLSIFYLEKYDTLNPLQITLDSTYGPFSPLDMPRMQSIDDFVVLGSMHDLLVIDFSSSGTPQVIFAEAITNDGWVWINDIAIDPAPFGANLYVGTGWGGIYKFDMQFLVEPRYSISGRIAYPNGDPIFGATVSTNTGEQATTNVLGVYKISNLASGTYSISASLPTYVFDPSSRTITVGPDSVNQDFVVTACTESAQQREQCQLPGYSISGYVTDVDGNPIAEAGVSEHVIGYTILTDENGYYNFDNITGSGTYIISIADFDRSSFPSVHEVILTDTSPHAAYLNFSVCGPEEWLGEYYSNEVLSGEPHLDCSSNVDFMWGTETPIESVPADHFSVRWTYRASFLNGGVYKFRTLSDDGMRVLLDGNLIIDDWIEHAFAESSTVVGILSDYFNTIVVEYFDAEGEALAYVNWYLCPEGESDCDLDISPQYQTRYLNEPMPSTCEDWSESGGQTIAAFGCTITSVAMALQPLDIDVTPPELNRWLSGENDDGYVGYSGDECTAELNWDAIRVFAASGDYGPATDIVVDWEVTDIDDAMRVIREGALPVIMQAKRPGELWGHWVLATDAIDINGEIEFGLNDPHHAWSCIPKEVTPSPPASRLECTIGPLRHVTTSLELTQYRGVWQPRVFLRPKNDDESISSTLQLNATGAELLLVNEDGSRVGYDKDTGDFLNDLPNSIYYGSEVVPPGASSTGEVIRTLYIAQDAEESYTLFVIADESMRQGQAAFKVNIVGHDEDLVRVEFQLEGAIDPGEVLQYQVVFQPGETIVIVPSMPVYLPTILKE